MYETMVYRETADQDPSDIVREFALIWQALPKVVFSRTLDSVEGANTTLARDDLRAELISLQESVRGDVAVGGAELAAEAARLDLIEEYRLFVHPVAVGGGIPFFPRDHRASSYAAILGARDFRVHLGAGCATKLATRVRRGRPGYSVPASLEGVGRPSAGPVCGDCGRPSY